VSQQHYRLGTPALEQTSKDKIASRMSEMEETFVLRINERYEKRTDSVFTKYTDFMST